VAKEYFIIKVEIIYSYSITSISHIFQFNIFALPCHDDTIELVTTEVMLCCDATDGSSAAKIVISTSGISVDMMYISKNLSIVSFHRHHHHLHSCQSFIN
jgi:hypothetical protein